MKKLHDNIVADAQKRIRYSDSFAKRKQEIQKDMMQARNDEIDSAGWFRKKLILWEIDRASTKKTAEELCPVAGLYLSLK